MMTPEQLQVAIQNTKDMAIEMRKAGMDMACTNALVHLLDLYKVQLAMAAALSIPPTITKDDHVI